MNNNLVKNTNTENDGMRYPSIDQLVKITHSKYRLVVAAAKRAKDLSRQENPEIPLLEHHQSVKAIGIALEEVIAGKIVVVEKTEEDSDNQD